MSDTICRRSYILPNNTSINIKNKQLLNTLYNLQNNDFDASAFISKLNNNDIITEEVSINFKSLADMQNSAQTHDTRYRVAGASHFPR